LASLICQRRKHDEQPGATPQQGELMSTFNANEVLQKMKEEKYTCIVEVKINNHVNPSKISEALFNQTYDQVLSLARVESLLRDTGVDTTLGVWAGDEEKCWNRVELVSETEWMYLEIAEDLPHPVVFIDYIEDQECE